MELVLDIFWSVGYSKVDLEMDMVVFLDRYSVYVVSKSSWAIVVRIGLVVFCFREKVIEIGNSCSAIVRSSLVMPFYVIDDEFD